jgi:hypothetical protein
MRVYYLKDAAKLDKPANFYNQQCEQRYCHLYSTYMDE